MPLEEVVASVTSAPAEVLQLSDWCRMDGVLERATLFKISDQPVNGRPFRDSQNQELIPKRVIIPTAVIVAKQFQSLESLV